MSATAAFETLLVEDNENDAEMLIRALRKASFTTPVVWMRDGIDALDFIFCRNAHAGRPPIAPRVILLDLKMPRMDGFDVLQALKSDVLTRGIPIIVMTSSNQDSDLERAYQLGANGFVTKPVQFAEFAHAVEKIGMFWLSVNRVR